ncbi:LCP family protein [Virgibacillus salexigens]|uniref:Transcriptional regulator n=1 Tax=Virgibacillus kapii TaxID=1638645 RepID=A0ABQ2DAV5_9BACI|nr:LCP family protein [Virgibacillus kapii]GGJ52031.1 transcriptional regulator [Virgibacillus kapii]
MFVENQRMGKRKQEKRRKRRKLLIYAGIPLTLIIIAVLSYGYHIYSTAQDTADDSYQKVGRENEQSQLRHTAVNPIEDNVSVLIIGVDDSENRGYNEKSRSDALLLATFNKEENSVKLLSIPRDSYVNVPEYGYTKINHAHFIGGPKKTMETVEKFMNIPVDYYLRVNFEAFIEVVDSLGGIEYDVPFQMREMDSNDNQNAIQLSPGLQQLNGEETLALARSRKYDSDVERGKRQQEIIKTIVKEAASASSIFKLDDLIQAVGSNLKTNLSFDEMKSFMSYGMNTDLVMNTVNFEGTGGKLDDGLWYYQVDQTSRTAIENELRTHLDLSTSNVEQSEYNSTTDEAMSNSTTNN